jgi:hypothetical protein
MRLRLAQLLVFCAVGLAGCESSAPASHRTAATLPPEADDRGRAGGLSTGEIVGARKLYGAKCARCHKFYDPGGYADAEWRAWMTKMSKKARLRPDQEQLLSRYLEAFRQGNRSSEINP